MEIFLIVMNDGCLAVVNEEGKINEMEPNRRLDSDSICGPFFICGDSDDGARIVNQWGAVGTELMVYVDGDISLFLGYKDIEFTAPVYVGDFMEYHGWIEKVGKSVLRM